MYRDLKPEGEILFSYDNWEVYPLSDYHTKEGIEQYVE